VLYFSAKMIKDNLKSVKSRIKSAAVKAGRNPDEIILVCVTKSRDLSLIEEAFEAGITDIGENRVQEALTKYGQITKPLKWHLVGHLQRNKAKDAARIFDIIHSVDSVLLADKINKECNILNKNIEVLVQLNVAEEDAKFGMGAEELRPFLKEVSIFEHIKIMGLMMIAPLVSDPESARPYFRKMKEIFESLKKENLPKIEMQYLSMGMSGDFEVAIEEGANMVRIGTAIFEG